MTETSTYKKNKKDEVVPIFLNNLALCRKYVQA